jgi:hypothetical protein
MAASTDARLSVASEKAARDLPFDKLLTAVYSVVNDQHRYREGSALLLGRPGIKT